MSTAPQQREQRRKGPKGPLELVIGLITSFIGSVIAAVILGTMLEIVGIYSFWKIGADGQSHAYQHLVQDYAYVRLSPRSLPVSDTASFANRLAEWARWPFVKCGVPRIVQKANAIRAGQIAPKTRSAGVATTISLISAQWLEVLVYVTQDVAIRLALALFALPGLLLILAVGIVDGLVMRDIRKWSGGRESSFVYHHAKHYAKWLMSAGFAAYLSWPFSGFNPTYLLLAFAVLTALALAITCSSFKKYL